MVLCLSSQVVNAFIQDPPNSRNGQSASFSCSTRYLVVALFLWPYHLISAMGKKESLLVMRYLGTRAA